MKEMLKSKTIILFIVFMMGIVFVSSYQTKMEYIETSDDCLVYNIK